MHRIDDTFCILSPDMALHPLPFTGLGFYEELETHFGDFNKHVLISCHTFNAPWDTWEAHPKGDECVILLSGAATMSLLQDGREHSTELSRPGQYIVVPRGVWHTATAANRATMLFITPGEGTQNRDRPPGD